MERPEATTPEDARTYREGIRTAVSEALGVVDPGEIAAQATRAGILGPLMLFPRAFERLAPEQREFITNFAQTAAEAARAHETARLQRDPIFALDRLLATEGMALRVANEEDGRFVKDELSQIEFARHAIRETQFGIIANADAAEIDIRERLGGSLPHKVDQDPVISQICAEAAAPHGYFYTILTTGRDYAPIMRAIGCDQGIDVVDQKIKELPRNPTAKVDMSSLEGLPTCVAGVTGIISRLSKPVSVAFVTFGVVFDRDAVARIVESEPLLKLPRQPYRRGG